VNPAQPHIATTAIVIKQVSVWEYDPGELPETQEHLLSCIFQPFLSLPNIARVHVSAVRPHSQEK